MNKVDKIYVAGHKGLVGSALIRKLEEKDFQNVIYRNSAELDLRIQSDVNEFFKSEKPDYVFLAAGKVGGILANNQNKAQFLYDNLMIQNNVIHAAFLNKVEKLLFLGSSCIYPKFAKQPISEDALLSGALEPTNDAYAIAKIAGIKMCDSYRSQYGCNFISAMPTNLYGPNDNYDLKSSHVLPALLRKTIEAKQKKLNEIEIWGTGSPLREFLHVNDLAEACIFLMENYNEAGHINVGSGVEVSILDLIQLIKKVVGYEGKIVHDLSKPDGTPRKLIDSSKINRLGWKAKISLEEGLTKTYDLIKHQF